MNKATELSQILHGRQNMLLFWLLRLQLRKSLQGQSLLKNASATIYDGILPNRAVVPAAARPPPSAAG